MEDHFPLKYGENSMDTKTVQSQKIPPHPEKNSISVLVIFLVVVFAVAVVAGDVFVLVVFVLVIFFLCCLCQALS